VDPQPPSGRPPQTPLTLVVPLKSPEAAAHLLRLLPAVQGEMRAALAGIPQAHFLRCVIINGGTELAMIATCDGDLDAFLDALLDRASTLLDRILEFVCPPAPLPVGLRRAEFKQYVKAHNAPAPFWYAAAAPLTAVQVRSRAEDQGLTPGDPTTDPKQNTLCAVLNVRAPENAVALRAQMTALRDKILQAFEFVGTVHFARFLFLRNETQFAIVTVFDGPFEDYARDFVNKIGEIFDALLQHVVGGDASLIPVREHFEAFHQIIVNSNYAPPQLWYSAYPGLTVQNKRTLLKDT
jgi:hypothetical protein